MRALTVRQPWATAIVRMGKDIENRTRNIAGPYRGPVAIHAGSGMPPGRRGTRTAFEGVGEVEYDLSGLLLRSDRLAWPYRLPLGVVIGVVDLVDVHHGWMEPEPCSPWGERYAGRSGLHHLVLANPRPLTAPVPATGRLGLWTLPDDIEARIREQVAL